MDDDLLRLGLDFYVREHETLLKLCKKLCRKVGPQREQLIEDAMHEAMRTIPMAMSTYRPGGPASLRTHVLGSVRWYVWKLLKGQLIQNWREGNGACLSDGYTNVIRTDHAWGEYHEDKLMARRRGYVDDDAELVTRDQVQYILERLPEAQALILRWRFCDELMLDEIAELLDCSKSTVHRYVEEALDAARRAV